MNRRDFFKAVAGAGLALTVPVALSSTPVRFGSIDNFRFIETNPDFTIIVLPPRLSPSDPLAQRGWIGWKAWGSDGRQYGDTIETTMDFDENDEYLLRLSKWTSEWIGNTEVGYPALSHLVVPPPEAIHAKLIVSLSE